MTKHKPVLLKEAVEALEVHEKGVYIDATLGGGGHSFKILENLGQNGKLITLDLDENAVYEFDRLLEGEGFKKNGEIFRKNGLEVLLVKENFRNIDQVLKKHNIRQVSGILADLGLSTDQIYGVEGISYLKDEKLDMRLKKDTEVTAADLLNGLYKKELVELFERLADVDFANELANEILKQRKQSPFKTTTQLKRLIQKVVPLSKRKGTNRQPEAKVFQALRIAVNDELNSLRIFLPLALEALAPEGRLAVISFHSGEDRIIKKFMREQEENGSLTIPSGLIRPSKKEIARNPRSASAKLRVAAKVK